MPRKFKKINADLLFLPPITDNTSSSELNFLKNDKKLEKEVIPVQPSMPTDYVWPDQMPDHINLVKAYLISGANNKSVGNESFRNIFLECFSPNCNVFQILNSGSHFQRKKNDFVYTAKVRVKSFIEFIAHNDTFEKAALDAIGEFRAKMQKFVDLLQIFVVTRCKNPTLSDERLSEEIIRRCHFSVKISSNGDINIPGFCSFSNSYSEFIKYLQTFSYELSSLNP